MLARFSDVFYNCFFLSQSDTVHFQWKWRATAVYLLQNWMIIIPHLQVSMNLI